MKLGTRVKELAKERGMSVAQVERLADIRPKSISGWDIHKPSADKVDRVLEVLEISHDEFYQKDKKISLSLSNFSKNIHDAVMADIQYDEDDLITEEEANLLDQFLQLNNDGKELVVTYINQLLSMPKYSEKNNTDTDSVSAS